MVRPQIERSAFLGGIGRPVIHDCHASYHFRQRQDGAAGDHFRIALDRREPNPEAALPTLYYWAPVCAGAFSGMKEAANQGGLLRGSTALNGIDARTERPQAAFLKADPHT